MVSRKLAHVKNTLITRPWGKNNRDNMPRSPVSAIHSPNDVAHYSGNDDLPSHPELAGPVKDVTPELPATDLRGRVELPPNPQRSLINSPKSSPSSPSKSSHAGSTSSGNSGRGMGSNLNRTRGRGAESNAGVSIPHVMSWMSYDGDAGPER